MDIRSKIENIEGSTFLTVSWSVISLLLILCIIFPLACVFFTPKLSDFTQVLHSSVWKHAAFNTFVECICSTTSAVIIGFIYAYAVVKINIPFKKFFAFIPLLHLVTPPFVGGLSFILLLGRQGFITSTILGLDISLYGFWGLLIAQSLCFFPLAYMICVQTLQGINPSFEQAAKSFGSNRIRIFWKITLPLAMPGILSSFLFIAVSVMSDFGNPMIVAGRYKVLAVEIYTQLTGWVNAGTSAVLGILLVIPSLFLFYFQNKITKKNMIKTATIGTKNTAIPSSTQKTPFFTTLIFTTFCTFISLCVIAQFAAIIAGSFQKLWGVNTTLTLSHIKNIQRYKLELFNSIRFALVAAFLSTFFACITSYLVYRTKSPCKKLIDCLIQIPAAIPGTLFGLAFLLASTKISFTHSPTLIILAITVGFLPFSYKIISASFTQIKTSLDDAGFSQGATHFKIFLTILLPLAKDGLFNSFIYDFVRGVGTMSAVIFLISFKTPLTSIKILNLAEQGFWGDAAALSLLLTIITFAVIGCGNLLLRFWSKK